MKSVKKAVSKLFRPSLGGAEGMQIRVLDLVCDAVYAEAQGSVMLDLWTKTAER